MTKKYFSIFITLIVALAAMFGGASVLEPATPVEAQASIIAAGTDGTCPWRIMQEGMSTYTLYLGNNNGSSCALANRTYDQTPDWPWANYSWQITNVQFFSSVEVPATAAEFFLNYSNLTTLDLSLMDFTNVENLSSFLYGCDSLETLILPASFPNLSSMAALRKDSVFPENREFVHTADASGDPTGDATVYSESDMLGKTSAQLAGTWTLAPASAPAPSAFTQYTPVSGDNSTLSLNKYLIVRSEASVPETTVSFSIVAGTPVAAGTNNFEILAGVGTPTIAPISFSAADTANKNSTVQTGDEISLATGESYVKKTIAVDFSSVSFPEPGVYRYIITESCADEGTFIEMDVQKDASATAKQRVLDVYVTDSNDGTKTLVISQYVLHEIVGNIASGSDKGTNPGSSPLTDKSDGFVNKSVSFNVNFGNETEGNQASRDKYFKFTVVLDGLQDEHTYSVDLSEAESLSGSTVATKSENRGQENPDTITSDENGEATAYFYLRDGQYVVIQGLPANGSYAITAVAEDYKQTAGTARIVETLAAGGLGNSLLDIGHNIGVYGNRFMMLIAPSVRSQLSGLYDDATSGSFDGAEGDIYTGYTHTRNGVIPTGLALSAAGTIAIAGVAVAGLIAKKKKEEE